MRPAPVGAQRLLLVVLLGAGVATLGLPPVPGWTLPELQALGVGLAAGALLFALLAGRGAVSRELLHPHGAASGRRLVEICLGAAMEEIAWRGFLLSLLAGVFTTLPALLITSGLFALAHDVRGRRRLVHVATGAVFALVYLGTGRVTAAIAAHAVYNTLVAVGAASSAQPAGLAALADAAGSSRVPSRREPGPPVPAEAIGVEKSFGDRRALAGVDLRLECGEVLALLGPNGAGKTTLVGILLGLRRPDRGVVRLFGRSPREPRSRARVGAVLQDTAFPGALRVTELIRLVCAHYRDPVPADELLDRFGLTAVAARQAGSLSGGQQRRLAVALAFAGRPTAVFLDEPTAGLDVAVRRALWAEIRAHADSGGSVLLTTHQFDEAEALATRVAVIDAGLVVAEGPPARLREQAGLTRVRLRVARLPTLRAAVRVERTAGAVSVYTRDPAALLDELRACGLRPEGLEVTPLSLEEAFLCLVSGGPA